MSHQKHYVTYFDYLYINYASVAVVSFLRTHEFDRLTLVTPSESYDAAKSDILAAAAESLSRLDPRIRVVDVAEIVGKCADPGTTELLDRSASRIASPAHLFSDTLRAYLYPWFGEPVVWFDSDILFAGDTSGVFEEFAGFSNAAAPDEISTLGDAKGLALYQAFADHVNGRRPGTMDGSSGKNIGFILLNRDVRPAYRDGLELALDFLSAEPDQLAHFVVGQLAWNYVFATEGAGTLPRTYNAPAQCLPAPGPGTRALRDGGAAVRHYIGTDYKRRMINDFARTYAWPGSGS